MANERWVYKLEGIDKEGSPWTVDGVTPCHPGEAFTDVVDAACQGAFRILSLPSSEHQLPFRVTRFEMTMEIVGVKQ